MKANILKLSFLTAVFLFSCTPRIRANGQAEVGILRPIVRKHIPYPDFARENMLSGFVVVSFMVDTLGRLVVLQMSTDSRYFGGYVQQKLSQLVVPEAWRYQGQTYFYRFDFKLLIMN